MKFLLFTHSPPCTRSSILIYFPFLVEISILPGEGGGGGGGGGHLLTQFLSDSQERSCGSAVLRSRPSNGSSACSWSHPWAYCDGAFD